MTFLVSLDMSQGSLSLRTSAKSLGKLTSYHPPLKYNGLHHTMLITNSAINFIPIFMTLLSIFIADVSHHRPTIVRSSCLLISTANVFIARVYTCNLKQVQFLESSII